MMAVASAKANSVEHRNFSVRNCPMWDHPTDFLNQQLLGPKRPKNPGLGVFRAIHHGQCIDSNERNGNVSSKEVCSQDIAESHTKNGTRGGPLVHNPEPQQGSGVSLTLTLILTLTLDSYSCSYLTLTTTLTLTTLALTLAPK